MGKYEYHGQVWSNADDSFLLDKVVVRWSLPQSPYTDDGLASGVSWALSPDFCDRLLPLFPEEDLRGCVLSRGKRRWGTDLVHCQNKSSRILTT